MSVLAAIRKDYESFASSPIGSVIRRALPWCKPDPHRARKQEILSGQGRICPHTGTRVYPKVSVSYPGGYDSETGEPIGEPFFTVEEDCVRGRDCRALHFWSPDGAVEHWIEMYERTNPWPGHLPRIEDTIIERVG